MSVYDPIAFAQLQTAVAVQAQQIKRIVADIESEKGTRARVNTEILSELKELRSDHHRADQFQNRIIGALLVLQPLVPIVMHFLLRKG